MKLQTLVVSEGDIGNVEEFLRDNYPERFSLIENWSELSFRLHSKRIDRERHIVFLEVDEVEFEKVAGIFPSKGDAIGAFLTTAREAGWEEVPERWVLYHAQFEGDKLIAGIKTEEGVLKFDQLHLEEMIQRMIRYPRIVVYSSDVLTYIKDLFPEVDHRAYVIAREIAKKVGEAPSLEDLGKVYGVDTSSLEGKLDLIERLLKNPVRLP
ncbi:MAG: hypothetical protein Q9N26_07450, partial [Aquificota bacterium]|nr:hypothetical protein [Aquificota bacterium]